MLRSRIQLLLFTKVICCVLQWSAIYGQRETPSKPLSSLIQTAASASVSPTPTKSPSLHPTTKPSTSPTIAPSHAPFYLPPTPHVLKRYNLTAQYNASASSNFFSHFQFYTWKDPSNGYVNYVNQSTALAMGLIKYTAQNQVYIGVDHQNVLPASSSGRKSIRLQSKRVLNGNNLIVLDLAHLPTTKGLVLPAGCSLWPAFWMDNGPHWPNYGEIDVIEYINQWSFVQTTLHTGANCTMANEANIVPQPFTSYWVDGGSTVGKFTNCYQNGPTGGCAIMGPPNSAGAGFDAITGGGVFVLDWDTSSALRMFYFNRSSVPPDLVAKKPNPDSWGLPYAAFFIGPGSQCSANHFINHNIIFDLTFCGVWAGNSYEFGKCTKNTSLTCNSFVQHNPQEFSESYWLINYLDIYDITAYSYPSSQPSSHPSRVPSNRPTERPSSQPTIQPAVSPTETVTALPTTTSPTALPTPLPTAPPTALPTVLPTTLPSVSPTTLPTVLPTVLPTALPSALPTLLPTALPSMLPSALPSELPSELPSVPPTLMTIAPTAAVPTAVPTMQPTALPTAIPSTPLTPLPSALPTPLPNVLPTVSPTASPNAFTAAPGALPTMLPTAIPIASTAAPSTALPTAYPTAQPTTRPTVTALASTWPSPLPSTSPSDQSSFQPSVSPPSTTVTPSFVASSPVPLITHLPSTSLQPPQTQSPTLVGTGSATQPSATVTSSHIPTVVSTYNLSLSNNPSPQPSIRDAIPITTAPALNSLGIDSNSSLLASNDIIGISVASVVIACSIAAALYCFWTRWTLSNNICWNSSRGTTDDGGDEFELAETVETGSPNLRNISHPDTKTDERSTEAQIISTSDTSEIQSLKQDLKLSNGERQMGLTLSPELDDDVDIYNYLGDDHKDNDVYIMEVSPMARDIAKTVVQTPPSPVEPSKGGITGRNFNGIAIKNPLVASSKSRFVSSST